MNWPLLPPDARMQRILALPVAQQRDLTQGIPFEKRQALLAGLSPEQRETVLALNNPPGGDRQRSAIGQAAARGLQRSPARRSAHRFLVQPLQCLHRQGRRPLPGHRLRARCYPPACAGQVQGPAGCDRQESGDAVLPGQLAERGPGLRSGARYAGPRPECRHEWSVRAPRRDVSHAASAAAAAERRRTISRSAATG